jgi:transposase
MKPEELAEQVEILAKKLSRVENDKLELEKKNKKLEEQVSWLTRQLFGRKTDRVDRNPDQQDLFNEIEYSKKNESPQDVIEVKAHKRKKKRGISIPENATFRHTYLDIAEADKKCAGGHIMTKFGEDETQKFHYIPPHIEVETIHRPKYVCVIKDCISAEGNHPEVKMPPLPPSIIPKSVATASFLAYCLVSKFCDGLPFYRQVYLLARIGFEITRATLCNWMGIAHDAAIPLLNLMKEYLLKSFLIGIDETPVRVLKEDGKEKGSKCFMWVFRGGTQKAPVILFHYDPGRNGDVPIEFLGDYKGYIQTDGLPAYHKIGKREGIILIGCWAHVRRDFSDIIKDSEGVQGVAHEMVAMIRRLYAIEDEVRDCDPEVIKAARQERSVPILNEIKIFLDKSLPTVAPESSLGKALTYMEKQWPKLIRYVDDGRIPIDNNGVENTIRPFVIGRKAWLFSDTADGARASAAFYSLIETAKANGLEPYSYLKYIFEQIPLCQNPDDWAKLLPWNVDREAVKAWKMQPHR